MSDWDLWDWFLWAVLVILLVAIAIQFWIVLPLWLLLRVAGAG